MPYSQTQIRLSRDKIRNIVSATQIQTLDKKEEAIVEQAVLKKRGANEMISLFQIDDVLRKLQNSRKISQFDRKSLMKRFEKVFVK